MSIFKAKNIAILSLCMGVILAFWYLFFGKYLIGDIWKPDHAKVGEIQPFITAAVVPLLTLGSALLVYENFRNTARQNFSNNFFRLIEMQHKIRDGIVEEVDQISSRASKKGDSKSYGKDFFDDLAERICFDYVNLPLNYKSDDMIVGFPDMYNRSPATKIKVQNKIGRDKLCDIYDYYFHVHQSDIGHYFRNLYYIIKYADDSNFSSSFKRTHIRILRAQLSNYEILLLAYNCLNVYGERFYHLVEKYELLKSLNDETRLHSDYEKRIIDIEVLREAYPHLKKTAVLNNLTGQKDVYYKWWKREVFRYTFSFFFNLRK